MTTLKNLLKLRSLWRIQHRDQAIDTLLAIFKEYIEEKNVVALDRYDTTTIEIHNQLIRGFE